MKKSKQTTSIWPAASSVPENSPILKFQKPQSHVLWYLALHLFLFLPKLGKPNWTRGKGLPGQWGGRCTRSKMHRACMQLAEKWPFVQICVHFRLLSFMSSIVTVSVDTGKRHLNVTIVRCLRSQNSFLLQIYRVRPGSIIIYMYKYPNNRKLSAFVVQEN